jgi:hypothetical protein
LSHSYPWQLVLELKRLIFSVKEKEKHLESEFVPWIVWKNCDCRFWTPGAWIVWMSCGVAEDIWRYCADCICGVWMICGVAEDIWRYCAGCVCGAWINCTGWAVGCDMHITGWDDKLFDEVLQTDTCWIIVGCIVPDDEQIKSCVETGSVQKNNCGCCCCCCCWQQQMIGSDCWRTWMKQILKIYLTKDLIAKSFFFYAVIVIFRTQEFDAQLIVDDGRQQSFS